MSNIEFAHPWFFLLLLLLPLLLFWFWKKTRQDVPDLKLSSLPELASFRSWKTVLRPFLPLLKIAAFVSLVIAIARPQNSLEEEKINSEGIDIVIATDISGSMLAQDFQPDRLGACKSMGGAFVDGRPHDRIGLVVFAGESFTQCPITSDHSVLRAQMATIRSGMVEDGTAIGMGLATAVNRLKESKALSKVIILLTDGVNNKGFIDPLTAAETAKEFGIKVYTIGVGTQGVAPYPAQGWGGRTVMRQIEVQIDEELLQKIADLTAGRYFRATNNNSLRNIYDEIDQLEKTELEVTTIKRHTERFHPFAFFAVLLLLLDIILRMTLFRGFS